MIGRDVSFELQTKTFEQVESDVRNIRCAGCCTSSTSYKLGQ